MIAIHDHRVHRFSVGIEARDLGEGSTGANPSVRKVTSHCGTQTRIEVGERLAWIRILRMQNRDDEERKQKDQAFHD